MKLMFSKKKNQTPAVEVLGKESLSNVIGGIDAVVLAGTDQKVVEKATSGLKDVVKTQV